MVPLSRYSINMGRSTLFGSEVEFRPTLVLKHRLSLRLTYPSPYVKSQLYSYSWMIYLPLIKYVNIPTQSQQCSFCLTVLAPEEEPEKLKWRKLSHSI